MAKRYFVYLLTNSRNTVLYTGVTSDLARRIEAHKHKAVPGFSARYNLDKLVYFEELDSAYQAVSRERQLKAGSRKTKEALIEAGNPKWKDLAYRL